MSAETSEIEEPLAVPLPRVATFVRQITHDVRNTLNSLDLQAAYLLELTDDAEAVEELKRMRSLIQTSAGQLQGLSSNFWSTAPTLIPYTAHILIEDLQDRLKRTHPEQAPRLQWQVRLEEATLHVDIEMLFGALTRIIENTFAFGQADSTISVDVFIEDERFILELRQTSPPPATDPADWGRLPFVSSRRGAYGLGLFRARAFLSAHEGDVTFRHDSGRNLLLTRVSLPLAPLHEQPAPPEDRYH